MIKKLNDFYSSTNIIKMINWGRVRWAGYVARMQKESNVRIQNKIITFEIFYIY